MQRAKKEQRSRFKSASSALSFSRQSNNTYLLVTLSVTFSLIKALSFLWAFIIIQQQKKKTNLHPVTKALEMHLLFLTCHIFILMASECTKLLRAISCEGAALTSLLLFFPRSSRRARAHQNSAGLPACLFSLFSRFAFRCGNKARADRRGR